MNNSIILFDGVCNLCNASINFIIKRDKKRIFRYTPLQSNEGKKLLDKYSLISNELNTVILIEENTVYTKSTAFIEITKSLSGAWKIARILKIIPKNIRDFHYDIIAGKRYKWFGKRNECIIPNENYKDLFLE
jgi:predicted DCC family thiol-disulfide oxidoreductase YuxK